MVMHLRAQGVGGGGDFKMFSWKQRYEMSHVRFGQSNDVLECLNDLREQLREARRGSPSPVAQNTMTH